jgi:hypothetical protein
LGIEVDIKGSKLSRQAGNKASTAGSPRNAIGIKKANLSLSIKKALDNQCMPRR